MNEESIEFASILIQTQIGLTMTKPCKDIRIKLIFPLYFCLLFDVVCMSFWFQYNFYYHNGHGVFCLLSAYDL
jgi:hypothetical protein